MCFICGENCSIKHRNKWSRIEGSIDETSKLYIKLLHRSAAVDDHALHSRLLSCKGDLVAVEARYHRKKGCLANYLSDRHTKLATKSESVLEVLCKELKVELYTLVEVNKHVCDLSDITSRLQELAKSKNSNIEKCQINGKQVKRMLQRVWPEIRFTSRVGLSDLVCADSVTVDDVLLRSVKQEKDLKAEREQNDLECSLTENFEQSEENDLSIVHKAALILRNSLLK